MIAAWFQGAGANDIYPFVVPNEEICDITSCLGLTESELFRIELPGGASRVGRAVGLISQSQLSALYAQDVLGIGSPSITVNWRENLGSTLYQKDMLLLPPKPVYEVPTGNGLALVEAVDIRYLWQQTCLTPAQLTVASGLLYTEDGRRAWDNDNNATLTSLVTAITGYLNFFGETIGIAAYAPNAVLLSRIADLTFTPNCSVAMALDMILAATGYQLQWDFTTGWTVTLLGGDRAALNSWMTSNKRAYMGGTQAGSELGVPAEPLLALWDSNANYQINAMPSNVKVTFPYRTVEGLTRHTPTESRANAATAKASLFYKDSQAQSNQTISTGRTRAPDGCRVLHEPRPIVAGLVPSVNLAAANAALTTAPGWDYAQYAAEVTNLLEARTTILFGKTVWAGWTSLPRGGYRTGMHFTLVKRMGEYVPVTVSECDVSEWLCGPHGLLPNDPSEIVFGKGMAGVRRLYNGAVEVDVGAPQTRVFAAKITGYEQYAVGKWAYRFVEVDPNFQNNIAAWVLSIPYPRQEDAYVAKNLCEYGNVGPYLQGTGVTAPGVLGANNPNAIVTPLPIMVDTVVTMVEYYSTQTLNTVDATQPPQYWFSMPNAVNVECVQQPPP
jgi:hypothetical protein